MDYTIYFAGELFDHKHLTGNATLAKAIARQSNGKFLSKLPQNFEIREMSAHAVRDLDIETLINCDLALFNFDGTQLDNGTVVEYMFAKFADIPSVILRTDVRTGIADHGEYPWNLMVSHFPRTELVFLDVLTFYQALARESREMDLTKLYDEDHCYQYSMATTDWIAKEVVAAFERVLEMPVQLSPTLTSPVFEWISKMPGFTGETRKASFLEALTSKRTKGLL